MIDALFIGAHPDDVEILAGGLVAKMTAQGKRVVIADGSRGEMGSRGTPEERAREAASAAAILKVEKRINLGLPDGHMIEDITIATRRVVEVIREWRPRLVFTHEYGDHHPDHNALNQAAKYACFQSNVVNYDTGQERFLPSRLFFYVGSRARYPVTPSFIADITAEFQTKINAMKAFRSQFGNDGYDGPETFLAQESLWEMIEGRASFFGQLINRRYGEPFTANSPLRIDDLLALPDV